MAPTAPMSSGPDVQQQGIPNVRIGADASVDAFGGGQSLTNLGDATQGVLKEASDIAGDAKQKSDQIAFMSADSQASALQNQIQINSSKMLGKDAMGAPDYAQQQWADGIQKIQEGLNNQDQQMAFSRSASSRWDELNKSVQVHVSGQMQAFDDNETSSYLTTSRNSAVLNSDDDDKINAELDRQKAVLSEWAARKGIPQDSAIYNEKLTDQISGTNAQVIAARLDNDSADNVANAKEYFDAHKDEMNASDVVAAQKSIDSAETATLGMAAWNEVGGLKLSNGMPNEQAMENKIMARDDISDAKKLGIVQFVKARAKEQVVQNNMEDASNDRDFMNQAIQARQQGVSLQDALKIPSQFAKDDYDQANKAKAIETIYAPPSDSDPHTFLNLWTGVQAGTAQKSAIDNALQNNQINVKDYRDLQEKYYESVNEGKNPVEQEAWKRVDSMALDKFGTDQVSKDNFLYSLRVQTQGQPPEQLIKSAQDSLQSVPGSGIFGTNFFGTTKWKADVQRLDAQNTAWGKVYGDVGSDTTKAIGAGALATGRPSWGLNDVDSFAQSFGGYDNIKTGTPANNAMQSLMKRGQLVTPANVKAVLDKYSDGKY